MQFIFPSIVDSSFNLVYQMTLISLKMMVLLAICLVVWRVLYITYRPHNGSHSLPWDVINYPTSHPPKPTKGGSQERPTILDGWEITWFQLLLQVSSSAKASMGEVVYKVLLGSNISISCADQEQSGLWDTFYNLIWSHCQPCELLYQDWGNGAHVAQNLKSGQLQRWDLHP